MIPGFLAGLAIGVVIVVLIIRSGRRPSAAPPGDSSRATTMSGAEDHVGADHGGITDHGGIHVRREMVKRRMVAKVTPDGLTVTIDDHEYHRLEDIPDPAVATEVRTLLASTTASITDPTTRASMEKELRDIGVEPDA